MALERKGGITYNTMVRPRRVVLDTNVLVAGLRSRCGASFRLLWLLGRDRFEVVVTVPLVLEYEQTLLSHLGATGLTAAGVRDFLDFVCASARHQEIFYLWRPGLRDIGDDLVLEAAVAGGCHAIITHNARNFGGAAGFGVEVLTPAAFLLRIGDRP